MNKIDKYKEKLLLTAQEMDEERGFINPYTGKMMEGVVEPKVQMLLKQIMARAEMYIK